MKIAIIGGTGWFGNAVAEELIARGHTVTAISRTPKDILDSMTPDIPSLYGDCKDLGSLLYAITDDTDVIVNAVIPDPYVHTTFKIWTKNVLECCRRKNTRLVAIADSCVFEVRPGLRLNQTKFLTPFYREWFGPHVESHEVYLQETEVDWVEIAPAAKCFPDIMKKEYQVSIDRLCTNDPAVRELRTEDPDHTDYGALSYISLEDYAYAVANEIEQPQYSRQRICVAWKENHELSAKEAAE